MAPYFILSGCPKYPAGETGLKNLSWGCKTPTARAKQSCPRGAK